MFGLGSLPILDRSCRLAKRIFGLLQSVGSSYGAVPRAAEQFQVATAERNSEKENSQLVAPSEVKKERAERAPQSLMPLLLRCRPRISQRLGVHPLLVVVFPIVQGTSELFFTQDVDAGVVAYFLAASGCQSDQQLQFDLGSAVTVREVPDSAVREEPVL